MTTSTSDSTEKRIGRWWVPVGCGVWLVLCIALTAVIPLMVRGEVTWGGADNRPNRLWWIEESELSGIGLSLTREQSGADGATCNSTSVRYFLWRGDASTLNTSYCDCYINGNHVGNDCG